MIQGGSNVVTARWGVHPDVAAVEVHRTAGVAGGQGEPVAVDGNRAFCDETAVDGVAYFYTLVACYPHPSGTGTLRSAPVVVLSGPAIDRLRNAPMDEIILTNTVPTEKSKVLPNMTFLSVAHLLAKAMRSIHDETSVSNLFV